MGACFSRFRHRHSNSGPPFFLIWSLPRLWYGSLSGSMSMNQLSIFYNISCYNSLVLQTFVSRSRCRITYIYAVSAHNLHGLRCSSSWNTSISVGNYYVLLIYTRSRRTICTGSGVHLARTPRSQSVIITYRRMSK